MDKIREMGIALLVGYFLIKETYEEVLREKGISKKDIDEHYNELMEQYEWEFENGV